MMAWRAKKMEEQEEINKGVEAKYKLERMKN